MSVVKFDIGKLVATQRALQEFRRDELWDCLVKHMANDWGDLCQEDKDLNDQAVRQGGRILSAYTVRGKKVWIITEADRASTTILLPDEY